MEKHLEKLRKLLPKAKEKSKAVWWWLGYSEAAEIDSDTWLEGNKIMDQYFETNCPPL